MRFQQGDKLCGFTVARAREVSELSATLVEMTHDKTGAELCWMDSGDVNKLFSVAFKTLPEDSTGVFHILEHSVLCGSEKYPVKEPFVELLKGSMNTFLNAMTFPDKTMYPVSSRNKTDFLNLTGVYLDAVFAPRILKTPDIFYQEGWHVELTEAGGEASLKGVVFNEMKGAMSSVDDVTEEAMLRLLYPDTCYGNNSGGDPEHIPDLTYEQFLASYRRYYHPSNARIWLDGDVPLAETLALIDDYLSRFERGVGAPKIVPQQPIPKTEMTQEFEVAPGEDEATKAHLAIGKVVCSWEDREKAIAIANLCDVLAGTNEAPLKRALLESGLCQDVSLEFEQDAAQPAVMLRVKNMDDEKRGDVLKVVQDTVRGLAENGLDKASLEASLSRYEFQRKEPHEPRGLIRNIMALRSWLYGGDPLLHLLGDDVFKSLHKKLDGRYFEDLLTEIFLREEGMGILRLLPSCTYGERQRAKEAARVKAMQDSWTNEEEQRVLALNEKLVKWQQTPDSPEALATLPKLALSEVTPLPEKLDTRVVTEDGVRVLEHKASCKGVLHVSLYFKLTDYTLPELTALSLLPDLLLELPTKRHSALALSQAVKLHMGDLSFSLSSYSRDDAATCTPMFGAYMSALTEKLPEAEELLYEVLSETLLDQKERVREIVLQANESAKQTAVMAGHALALARSLARYSAQRAVYEAIGASGVSYTRLSWLRDFAEHFDERYPAFLALLERFVQNTVCRARMEASVTSAGHVAIGSLLSRFDEGAPVPASAEYRFDAPGNEGVRIPAQIGFAVLGYHLSQANAKYHGSARVLANILSYAFLWNKVRVQGGAYGAGASLREDGALFCYSYRDPSAARSLGVYRALAQDIRAFCESDEELTRYIISAIAETEPLKSPRQVGIDAYGDLCRGDDWEKLCLTRRETLETTKADLLRWADVLEDMAQHGAVCVVGHTDALDACKDEALTIREI